MMPCLIKMNYKVLILLMIFLVDDQAINLQ